MNKKGANKKRDSKGGPIIVVVLAAFLIVISIVSIISVNERFKDKLNELSQSSSKNSGSGKISVIVQERPNFNGNVALVIEPRPSQQ
jgi:hypothetical protein